MSPRAGRARSSETATSAKSARAAKVSKRAAAARRRLEAAISGKSKQEFVLRLYVTGATPASNRAIEKVRELCEMRLHGRYDLQVIDICQMPALTKDHQIIATPTLVKVLPAPLRRWIGDLSKVERVLFGLDLLERN